MGSSPDAAINLLQVYLRSIEPESDLAMAKTKASTKNKARGKGMGSGSGKTIAKPQKVNITHVIKCSKATLAR